MILKKLCELHWWGSEIQRFGLIYHTTYYDSEDTYHTGLFSITEFRVNKSPIQYYTHPGDHAPPTYEITRRRSRHDEALVLEMSSSLFTYECLWQSPIK